MDTAFKDYPYQKKDIGGGPDVSLSLCQVMDLLSCPHVCEQEIEHLSKTPRQKQELRALVALWHTLGCPDSPFWRETRVFVNRIIDAPKEVVGPLEENQGFTISELLLGLGKDK